MAQLQALAPGTGRVGSTPIVTTTTSTRPTRTRLMPAASRAREAGTTPAPSCVATALPARARVCRVADRDDTRQSGTSQESGRILRPVPTPFVRTVPSHAPRHATASYKENLVHVHDQQDHRRVEGHGLRQRGVQALLVR